MTFMPNIIFSCQITLKKAKFLEFGLKNANLATLLQSRPRSLAMPWVSLYICFENKIHYCFEILKLFILISRACGQIAFQT